MGFDAGNPKFLSVSLNAIEYGLEMSINVPSKSKARAVMHSIIITTLNARLSYNIPLSDLSL
jgi:hypothetical protein